MEIVVWVLFRWWLVRGLGAYVGEGEGKEGKKKKKKDDGMWGKAIEWLLVYRYAFISLGYLSIGYRNGALVKNNQPFEVC